MCGRYYVNENTADAVEDVLKQIGVKADYHDLCHKVLVSGDIHPADEALVLKATRQGIVCCTQKWGLAGFPHGQLLINARCETAAEKHSFQDGILKRRIAIPAAGFYEWNQSKEKSTFQRRDGRVAFLAGFYEKQEDGEHFIILTTAANSSVKTVHDRMPLILEADEVLTWLTDDTRMGALMQKVPGDLERRSDYEQLSLF